MHTRAKTRLRLLVLIVTALSLLGSVCCKAGDHQSKTSEAVERDVGLDPKQVAPLPPLVAHAEHIRHSSHGSDQARSKIWRLDRTSTHQYC